MDITREDVPSQTVAVVRSTVPMTGLTAFYDAAYARVTRAVAAAGGRVDGPAVGWYHGMPTDTVDVAAGFRVADLPEGPDADGVDVVELPGGPALVGTYVGSYDGLGEAWGELAARRAVDGVDGRGDFWEEYVTDPLAVDDAATNVTRLVLPLA